jgi:uncharacterized protein YlzI (FlbEa/FlbD family)
MMTGPFISVQEVKLSGQTWVNVALIVKIQQSSDLTMIFLAGAGTLQVKESAEALVHRLERALAGTPEPARVESRGVTQMRRRTSAIASVEDGTHRRPVRRTDKPSSEDSR